MTGSEPTVAAFDVDGTITTRDCVVPFLRRIAGARALLTHLGTRPHRTVPGLLRGDRDAIKSLATAATFRGRSESEIRAIGADFAQHVHDRWLRSDTMERFREHRSNGDRVVLVSASYEVYLRPLAQLLGADGVLATRLMAVNGVLTGALDGPNCRGPEKVRRLHQWLDAHLGGRDRLRLVAYGDSVGDRELLADADEAHWVAA